MTHIVRVRRVGLPEYMPLPAYAREGDAGLDLPSAEKVVIEPGRRQLVGTGLAIGLPEGTVGLIHPRSGIALKHGVTVLNTPGTVDSGYTGELKVLLHNTGDVPFHIEVGDRIAQLVVQEFLTVGLVEVIGLEETERGIGGFGHSGR